MSETNTSASTSTSATATGNEMILLVDEIKKYDTVKLIEFLQEQENLGLNEPAIKILENEEINSHAFINITEEKLRNYGMKGGPASNIAVFAKECKDKKLRLFSSYKTKKELSEVLCKYGIDSNEITKILLFEPEPVEIDDEDEELE